MPAPDTILKLCETFAGHRDHFRSGNSNEAQLRQEFLDPFFKSLGWDMDNAQGLAPQYRDVIHEDALKIGIHTKAPDYIVDYTVRNTLGRLLNGADPANPQPISLAAAAKLKVADIACGSGSFLIQAYRILLDWHRDRYLADPEKCPREHTEV